MRSRHVRGHVGSVGQRGPYSGHPSGTSIGPALPLIVLSCARMQEKRPSGNVAYNQLQGRGVETSQTAAPKLWWYADDLLAFVMHSL